MAAVIEIKYYNSFWLKKIDTMTVPSATWNGGVIVPSVVTTTLIGSPSSTLTLPAANTAIGIGQTVSFIISNITYTHTVISNTGTTSIGITPDTIVSIPIGTTLTFNGNISNYGFVQTAVPFNTAITTPIVLKSVNSNIGVGQSLSYTLVSGNTYTYTITYVNGVNVYINKPIYTESLPADTKIVFGAITDYSYIPSSYNKTTTKDWYIEEARIRGGYNNTSVDFGVKAYIVEDHPLREKLFNSLIYSGVFNSKTGVNNTNQFSVGENITRSLDPANGSIQKLFAEDTNLTVFQESKVSRALIDKDAIYSAEGQPMTTSGVNVIGQVQAYGGNYGIGTNPESFATYGYRKYFTDKNQNVVLRLSQDGITEISEYGMFNYFRDKLSNDSLSNGLIRGIWDMHSKQYIISVQPTITINGVSSIDTANSVTLAFDEECSGWTSFFSYIPNGGLSLKNNYYTFNNTAIWKHYSTDVPKGSFYGVNYKSNVTLILNPSVSEIKSFLTINYEGTQNWGLTYFYTDTDISAPVSAYFFPQTLTGLQDQLFENKFKKKENKYFCNLLNISYITNGDVINQSTQSNGKYISGIKGFFATATFSTDNATVLSNNTDKAELFAVSAEYVNSSY